MKKEKSSYITAVVSGDHERHDGILAVFQAPVNQAENEKPIDAASRMEDQETASVSATWCEFRVL